jgi:hypothetical protein
MMNNIFSGMGGGFGPAFSSCLNSSFGSGFGNGPLWMQNLLPFMILIPIVLLWSLFWKGLALWHSGRKGNARWFILLLLVNTLGILEIIYLFGVLKLKFSELFSTGKSNPTNTL